MKNRNRRKAPLPWTVFGAWVPIEGTKNPSVYWGFGVDVGNVVGNGLPIMIYAGASAARSLAAWIATRQQYRTSRLH